MSKQAGIYPRLQYLKPTEFSMTEHITDLITWAFFAANIGRILAYSPQLVAAWKCENGAKSVSRFTWGYFAFANLTGILYSLLVIYNRQMALVFAGNFLVCCLLVGIVTWKKNRHHQPRVQTPTLTCIVGKMGTQEAISLEATQHLTRYA
jgi:uncharacterized protein with PQ loop repeat